MLVAYAQATVVAALGLGPSDLRSPAATSTCRCG
jgi:hypothetical protein